MTQSGDPPDKRGWLDRLLNLLPPLIRPADDDRRFLAACAQAYDNQWTPEQLAAVITRRDYTTARNPVLIAITRLEETATRPPTPPATITVTPTCDRDCVEGWLDQDDGPTRPCPTCRPQLAARLHAIPPPGQRTQTHLAYLRDRRTMR